MSTQVIFSKEGAHGHIVILLNNGRLLLTTLQ